MDEDVVFMHISKVITSTKATSKWICALRVVIACGRMRYSKWAVFSLTVANFDYFIVVTIFVVTTLAEVMRAKTAEQGDGAAVHTLPIDLFFSVLVTFFLAGTVSLQLAAFAAKIFFFCVFFNTKLSLAVDHTTKVRFLTVVALVESACMHCKLKQVALVVATLLLKTLIIS